MKKTTLIVMLVFMVFLLVLTAFTAVMFFGNGTVQPCCSPAVSARQSIPSEAGNSRGFGMMGSGRTGPGMMGSGRTGPGMMGSMNVFIENEYDFLVHMIPHHEEAVFTATYLRDNTEREEMRSFAESIIKTQTTEIEQMVLFLGTWYPNQNHQVDYQPMMRDLEGLQGDLLDRAFLEDMIPHHMTAVMMSQQLLSRRLAEHEEVAILAQGIRNSQHDEIQMMMNWLANWNSSAPLADRVNWTTPIWFGVLALTVFLALIILLFFVLNAGKLSAGPSAKQAQEILKKRYVMGDITREEFLSVYEELKN